MARLPYEDTMTSKSRSIQQIVDVLEKYGADMVGFQNMSLEACTFELVFRCPPPPHATPDERAMHMLPVRLSFCYAEYLSLLRKAKPNTKEEALRPKAERAAYRAVLAYLKTTLEQCYLGFTTLPQAFLAGFVGPDGRTLGETAVPRLVEFAGQGEGALALPE